MSIHVDTWVGVQSDDDSPGHNPGCPVCPECFMRQLAVAVFAALLTGCTWVHMAPGANAVTVVTGPPAGCEQRGEVEVSVKDALGPYERNPLRVRDELETLARNEAPGLGADTVQALGEPADGRQRFAAWRCKR